MTLLDTLTVELRAELMSEVPTRLHESAGLGKGRSTKGGAAGDLGGIEFGNVPAKVRASGWTGLPFTREFQRYLSDQRGADFIADDSFAEIHAWCRREHWREQHVADDPFAWGLCARLAIAVVELRQPIVFVAEREGIDRWLVKRLLTDALVYAKRWRAERRKGVTIHDESRSHIGEAEALPIVLGREHLLDRERAVWEGLRRVYPFLRSWESELERRRSFHARHCVHGCILLDSEAA